MKTRPALLSLFLCAALAAGQAFAQSGLRLPQHGEPGLDPAFARGWLAPDYDRFGFSHRMHWSYSLSDRSSLGMAMYNGRELEEQRQLSFYGRYSLTPHWAVSAETMSRDPSGLFRLQDFRIGVQRRF